MSDYLLDYDDLDREETKNKTDHSGIVVYDKKYNSPADTDDYE